VAIIFRLDHAFVIMSSNDKPVNGKPTETTTLIQYGVIKTSAKGKKQDKLMDEHQ